MGNSKLPYRSLGRKLKALREHKKETIGEVSGAVEIDSSELSRFELGQACPSEEIMTLLINHFEMKEDEADKLWEMAGYNKAEGSSHMMNDDNGGVQPVMMALPGDARIVYTDMVHVMVNNYGVVMNFMQGAGPNVQPLAIARIGMSKEHAKSVLDVLSTTLKQAEAASQPKHLPQPKKPTDSKD